MTAACSSLQRRLFRPRLSLRLTMVIVLITALGLGWLITSARRQAETVDMVRRLGGEVQYDWEYRNGKARRDAGPIWLTDVVGPDYNHHVTSIDLMSAPKGVDDLWADRLVELAELETLHLGQSPKFTDAGLARLSGMNQLEHLGLTGTGVSGRGFVHLRNLTGLLRMHAMGVPTLDADLAHLSGLSQLKSLVLQGDRLTDAGLAYLRPLKSLESLQIPSNAKMGITSTGLAHLSGMVKLRELNLSSSKIESIEPLRSFASLIGLHLVDASLDDESLALLGNFTKLEILTLMGKDQRFGDAGLSSLAGLKSLDTLWLNDTRIGNAGLSHLAGLTKLQILSLDGTRVTDAGLEQLITLPGLKTLSLSRTAITDAGLAQLVKLTACKEIHLKETKTTPIGIIALKAKLPGVQIN